MIPIFDKNYSMVWIIVIIGLILVIFTLTSRKTLRSENRTKMFRSNLVVGNKCKIIDPENHKKKITAEIIDIQGDIIYVKTNYKVRHSLPRNEIFSYE